MIHNAACCVIHGNRRFMIGSTRDDLWAMPRLQLPSTWRKQNGKAKEKKGDLQKVPGCLNSTSVIIAIMRMVSLNASFGSIMNIAFIFAIDSFLSSSWNPIDFQRKWKANSFCPFQRVPAIVWLILYITHVTHACAYCACYSGDRHRWNVDDGGKTEVPKRTPCCSGIPGSPVGSRFLPGTSKTKGLRISSSSSRERCTSAVHWWIPGWWRYSTCTALRKWHFSKKKDCEMLFPSEFSEVLLTNNCLLHWRHKQTLQGNQRCVTSCFSTLAHFALTISYYPSMPTVQKIFKLTCCASETHIEPWNSWDKRGRHTAQ